MTNPRIATYQDLLDEKERLKQLLSAQKELVRQDFNEIKAELAPVRNAFSFIGKVTTKDKSNPLLNGVADTVIDIFIKRMILSRTGWITRLAVPFLMKNFSSHLIGDNKKSILKKVFSLFGSKRHMNGDLRHENLQHEKQEEPLK